MTLAQLKAFWLSATSGSFTAAARELGTTQPTVSELVRKLEDENGLPLFVRAGRRLTLTPAGAELLSWAQRVVESVAGAEEALRALRGLEGGVASFGVLRNAPFYFLTDLVADFHAARPGVRARIIGQNSFEVAEAVRAGELEAGLIVLPVPDDGLDIKPLIRDEVLWVSADPQDVVAPVTMERVATTALILYDAHYGWSDPTRRQLADRAQAAGVRLEPLIEVENVESALDLVSRGMGQTIASRSVVRHASFPSGLRATAFAEPFYETIALVKRRASTLSPGTAELAQMATTMLLAVPWATPPTL
ncbi:MAG: LysR family transcriptional regulator [Propionibacteriaceae bacterium]